MGLIEIVLYLIILGLILYGVNALPIPGWVKIAIQVTCAIAVVLMIASAFGVHTGLRLR